MDVLTFDCDDYKLTISTADVTYSWERFFRRVKDEAFSYCDYSSTNEGRLSLYNLEKKEWNTINEEVEQNCWTGLWPVLFETCEYQFGIEFKHLATVAGKPIQPKVLHQVQEVGGAFKFYPNEDHSGVFVGTIDFLNSPGKFAFQFEYKTEDGKVNVSEFELYVASPKLDTKNDLNKIITLINQEYENYVFEYLTLTFSSLTLKKSAKNNKVIWLSIFKKVVDDYFRNVRYIMSRPNNKPIRKTYYSKPDKIRRWSQAEIEKYKRYGMDADLHYYRNEVIEKTVNTRENRFVKYTLRVLGKKYLAVSSFFLHNYPDMAEEEKELLKDYNMRFKQLAADQFFKHVGEFEGLRQESAILQQRTGYSQIYRAWIMLKCSLDLEEGRTDIGMKKIWELYEIWCFLVMKRLIAKVLDINLQEQEELPEAERLITENKSEMLSSMTKKDINHIITFKNRKNSDIVKLEYQHTYNRKSKDEMKSTTTEQRPDILVTITKTNGFVLTYLYDAKYRVQDDVKDGELDDGETIDLADYPLPDAINQMHRYRDAIYYSLKSDERPQGKEVIGGYILFPGRTEGDKIKERYFFKSIDKVNIGAFPLLPSASENEGDIIQCPLLEEHLQKILLDDSIHEHIKDSVPQKGLAYSPDTYKTKEIGESLVMICYSKHIDWVVSHMYNIPLEQVTNPKIMQAKYVLLLSEGSKNSSFLYRVVKSNMVVWTRDQLKGEGYPSENPKHASYFMIGLHKLETAEVFYQGKTFDVSGYGAELRTGFAFRKLRELVIDGNKNE